MLSAEQLEMYVFIEAITGIVYRYCVQVLYTGIVYRYCVQVLYTGIVSHVVYRCTLHSFLDLFYCNLLICCIDTCMSSTKTR